MANKFTAASTITLYRSILRAHSKSLPIQMRILGDKYVKSEFKLHKSVTDEAQLGKFFSEWEKYLAHIQKTVRAKETRAAGLTNDSLRANYGVDLDDSIEINDEQKVQLQKLREEASKAKTSLILS